MALCWGIVSTGKISHDFVTGLNKLPSNEHSVVAVAARDLERSKEFAKTYNVPNAFGSYEELAKFPAIESIEDDQMMSDLQGFGNTRIKKVLINATRYRTMFSGVCSSYSAAEAKKFVIRNVIYIGALNPQHFEIGMLMLKHGKHVLVEKPLCMNEKQARHLITYAKEQNLFLMEGIWSRFFPAVEYVREQIASGVLGTIQEVDVTLGVSQLNVDRSMKKELGGGTIIGLGVYVIQLAQMIFQEPPIAIRATGELNEHGVDIAVVGELEYSGGKIAKIETSAKEWLENKAIIKGTKGQLTLPKFWCPTSVIDVDNQQKEWTFPFGKYKTNFPNSEGLVYEAQAVRRCILQGKLESEDMSHAESLLIAHIEDSLRNQVGVVYAED